MTVSIENAEILEKAGFIRHELEEFDQAPAFPNGTITKEDYPAWWLMIESRQGWTEDKRQRGWSSEEIENEIMNYYLRDVNRTPFDFLKRTYRPPKKLGTAAAYYEALNKRHQKQIEESMPGYYERGERKYKR